MSVQEAFIREHPDAYVSVVLLGELVNNLSTGTLRNLYQHLGSGYKQTDDAKKIDGIIRAQENVTVGRPAIPIRKKDLNGMEVSLATLKGKFVLLDFWGSWCGPCRASHPHLKELYFRYKEKGLEIVGIAYEQYPTLAENYRAVKTAVKQDAIPWRQVLNNDGIKTFDAVSVYGVTAFPTKILLGKDGRILQRFVGDESQALDLVLKKIMDAQN